MAVSNTTLIPRVRRWLDERPYVDVATASNASDTTLDVTDGADWEEGDIVEFQDDGEQCLVRSVSGNTLTVLRGWNGTTAAGHTSITVFKSPQYTYYNILQSIDSAIDKLWPYAYKVATTTITPDSNTLWYNLTVSNFIDLVSVQQVYGSVDQAVGVFGQKGSGRSVVLGRNLPSSLAVTDGIALQFPYGFWDNSNDVLVTYRTYITGTADIEDDGRLPVADAVVFGATAFLLQAKESERVGEGEDLETARSVRSGARATAGVNMERLWKQALVGLKEKHELRYPPMRSV